LHCKCPLLTQSGHQPLEFEHNTKLVMQSGRFVKQAPVTPRKKR
jgi:hypothetical protein